MVSFGSFAGRLGSSFLLCYKLLLFSATEFRDESMLFIAVFSPTNYGLN